MKKAMLRFLRFLCNGWFKISNGVFWFILGKWCGEYSSGKSPFAADSTWGIISAVVAGVVILLLLVKLTNYLNRRKDLD
jgi:hypothetical protein